MNSHEKLHDPRGYGAIAAAKIQKQIFDLAYDDTRDNFDDFFKKYLEPSLDQAAASIFLKKNTDGFTLIRDAIHLPFRHRSDKPVLPHDLQCYKARTLTAALLKRCHEAISAGKMSAENYTQALLTETSHRYSLLHEAVNANDLELYRMIAGELQKLRAANLITKEQLIEQYTTPNSDGYTPLFDVVAHGNDKLFKAFWQDMSALLTPEQKQAQLLHKTSYGSNIFHIATRIKGANGSDAVQNRHPSDPDTVIAVLDCFFESFGNGQQHNNPKAQATVVDLLGQKNKHHITARTSDTPGWLQELLSMSGVDSSPNKPGRTV